MHNIGLAEDGNCRFSKEEEETTIHVLCHNEDLARARFLVVGLENTTAHTYIAALKDDKPHTEGKVRWRVLGLTGSE